MLTRAITGLAIRVERLLFPSELSQRFFQRPIELAVAVAAIAFLPRPSLALALPGQSLLMDIGLALIIVVHLLIAVACLWPHLATTATALILLLSAAASVAMIVGQLTGSGDSATWAVDVWFGMQLVFIALLHPRGWRLPVMALISIAGLPILAVSKELPGRELSLGVLFLLASLALLALGRLYVMALADEYLLRQEAWARELEAEMDARSRAEALAAIRRDAHDTLLHCLQLVAQRTPAIPDALIRDRCRATRTLLTRLPETAASDHSVNLDEVLLAHLKSPAVDVTWRLAPVSVPAPVAAAILAAGTEALRNVAKHTPDRRATVTLDPLPEGLLLTISDTGPGFSMADVPSGRLGVRDSIVGQMRSVGGLATITSDQLGTTANLRWPAPSPTAPRPMGPQARARLAAVPLPLVIASAIHLGIMHFGAVQLPGLLTWLAFASVVLVACRIVKRRGLNATEAWAMCAAAMAVLLLNYLQLDEHNSDVWTIWAPSLAGAMAILALPGRKVSTALLMAAALIGGHVTLSIAVFGVTTTFVDHFGALMSLGIDVALTLVLVFSAAMVARYDWRTRHKRLQIAHRTAVLAQREGFWRGWLARASQLVAQFLDDVADSRLPIHDPGTVLEAQHLEARLRDELRLWPGDATVAAQLDRLRRLGWRCRFDLEAPQPELRHDLAELLENFPRAVGTRQMLSVVARDRGVVLTVTTPALTASQREPLAPWIDHEDPEFTQLTSPRSRQESN